MTTPSRASTKRGIQFKIGSVLCLTLMLACIKGLGGAIPPGEIAFYRASVTLVPMLAWVLWSRRADEVFRAQHLARHLGRGVSGSLSMFLSFITVACLPLADAILLGYVMPLMTVVLGLLALKERVPGYRWAGALAGAAGVLIAMSPHLGQGPQPWNPTAALGIASGLVGALCAAISVVQIRHLALRSTPVEIVFYYTLCTGVLGALTWPLGWNSPDGWQLALLMASGVFGGLANFLVAQSLRHAHVSVLAPFEYTTLVWSALISWAVFDQAPGAALLAGGALVAASGVFTAWREGRAMASAPHG